MMRQLPSTTRRASAPILAAVLLILAAPCLASPALDGGETQDRAAQLLSEALLALRARGLKIVFSSRTVLPTMRVAREPSSSDPRQALDELLAPHGLVARDGPSGSVVVIAAPPLAGATSGAITGVVRQRETLEPVGGVELELRGTGVKARSGADGGFHLAPPGPGTFTLDVRRRGFVIDHIQDVVVVAGTATQLALELDRAPVTREEVVVTPSRISLLREQPASPLALSRDDIFALPHLGDDIFRALSLLTGVAANDVSAEFHVRGGRSDETQILLDGQELYESYHLKDLDSALSVVSAATLDSVDLSTGGFPVEHGDRMSGVLDMTTRAPEGPRRTHVGLSLLGADLGGAGLFAQGRGGWLAQGRRGAADLAGTVLGPERPQFWDAFGKLDYQLTPRQSLRLSVLHSDDELEFRETRGEARKSRDTRYENSYLWLTHQAFTGADLLVESAVSRSRVDRDRRGSDTEEDAQFDIADRRRLAVAAARQEWSWRAGPVHTLKWGFEARDFEALYDYSGAFEFDNPVALIREGPNPGATRFTGSFDSDHGNLYLADRARFAGALSFEVGLRVDRHSLTDEDLLSPRLNLALDAGARSVIRASWGRFTQSQRPYELQVQDGETAFHPVERSEHAVVGFERLLGGAARSGPSLRVELYRRFIDNPLPRHENLYEPINAFPEAEPDRVLVAPQSSRAEGFEVFLRGRANTVGWWVNYTYAESEDDLDGVKTPRRFDQTHALNLDLDLRLGAAWTLNLAWRFHTGWPTTPLSVEERPVEPAGPGDEPRGELEFVPVLGPRFSARLPNYHRLDLRASRKWRAGATGITFFVDVQNAYDRANVAGYDFQIDEENGRLLSNPETWAGILPSVGIGFDF